MMTLENASQVLLIATSFGILIGYHLRLYIRLYRRPETTSIGLTNRMRSRWVQNMMESGKKDVLPVQTLRNLTMAASFLASTAIIVGLGILNLAFSTKTIPEASQLLMLFGSHGQTQWTIKLMLLWGDFLFCFYNFMLAVRYYNHTALLINVPLEHHASSALHRPGYLVRMPPIADAAPGVKLVADVLNQGAAHYTLGMRGYYFVVPLALWLLGEIWLFLGTVGLTLVLHRIDSAAE
jgi:uncharacterized membrane protein